MKKKKQKELPPKQMPDKMSREEELEAEEATNEYASGCVCDIPGDETVGPEDGFYR